MARPTRRVWPSNKSPESPVAGSGQLLRIDTAQLIEMADDGLLQPRCGRRRGQVGGFGLGYDLVDDVEAQGVATGEAKRGGGALLLRGVAPGDRGGRLR